jgi:hypothetical protein
MTCPYCTATLPDGSRLCQSCGRLLSPTAPPPSAPPPQQPPPHAPSGAVPGPQNPPWAGPPPGAPGPFGPGPGYQPPGFSSGGDPYHRLFDVRRLPPDAVAAYRQHQFKATFSVLLAVLVHVLTFGMASWPMIARKHSFLPRIKPDDFSTARGIGFLFIPFYNFYWCFVLAHRTVDRLALQTKLWGTGGPPSRGLGTALAILSVLTAIPYIGILILGLPYFIVWGFFLAQVQKACNALALAAAPETIRPAMLQLERWTRLRWIGWMLLGPSLVVITSAAGALLGRSSANALETVLGMSLFALVGAGGAVMLYLGSRDTRELYHTLSSGAPLTVAGYLRIDKNGAWTVVWVAGIFGLFSLLSGVIGLVGGGQSTSGTDAASALGQALGLLLLAGYGAYKALQLKAQIGWLESAAATTPTDQTWSHPR